MCSRNLFRILAVFMAVALTVPAMAATMKATVHILDAVKLAGQEIEAGWYDVEATDTKVIFKQNNKVVAEAPVKWEKLEDKARNTSVVTTSGEISEIRFKGKTEYVVLE